MRNFLIPTGVAYFPGNYMELLRMIGSIDGTLDDENRFHCKVSFPRTNFGTYGPLVFFHIRGRIEFTFRCSIERWEDSYKINYRVYPSFGTMLCLIIIGFTLASYLFHAEMQELLGTLTGCCVSGGILFVIFWLSRRSAIRRFVRRFEGEDESIFT